MDKIELEILGLSSSHSQTGSFALVLGESGANRRLPIIIGMFEAQAIAIEIENITSNRPMTHDLFTSFAEAFEYDVLEIIIAQLKEGIFYAKIIAKSDITNEVHEIDSRPSDAIAIALRFNVPIYTNEAILSEAGIIFSEQGTVESKKEDKEEKEEKKLSFDEMLAELTLEQLEIMLNDLLEKEDYEKAAKVRDEINNRKK